MATRVVSRVTQGLVLVAAAVAAGPWLDDVLPGPAVLRAFLIAVLLVAARSGVSLLGRLAIKSWPIWPEFFATGLENELMMAGILVVASFVAWGVVAVTHTLYVNFVLVLFLALRGNAVVRLGEPPDDEVDPRLAGRLRRFCAELGIDNLATTVMPRTELQPGGVPTVNGASLRKSGGGRPLLLLTEWMQRMPPPVIDTAVAAAVVRARRSRVSQRVELVFAFGLILGAAAVWSHGLLRIVGVDRVGDPGFVPTIIALWSLAALAGTQVIAPIEHVASRRDVPRILDLTRDPETFVALTPATTTWRRGALRWLHPELDRSEAQELIDQWTRSRKVCLLFTDIVGSTELLDSLGDDAWDEVIFEHDRRLRRVFAARQGRVIDRAGDGYAVSFDDVGSAVLAAMEAQKALWDLEARPGQPVRVRIGCHTGEVIRREDVVIGREMHITARVCGLAEGGEILATEEVVDELKDVTRFTFGPMRREHLRGFADDHGVAQVCFAIDE